MPDTDAYTEVIDASPEQIVKTLTDFESYPQWQTGVQRTVVHERDELGRGTVVEIVVDAKVRRIRYRSRYFYDDGFGWDYIDGDLADCAGRYTMTPRADGRTELTLDLVTEVGFYLPGPVKRLIRDQALRNSMRDLRRRLNG